MSATGTIEISHVYLNWYKQDQVLLEWLQSSILEPILAQFVCCHTSVPLWASSRSSLYSASSCACMMESCSASFEEMKSIADELASIGSPVSDAFLISSILTRLGPDFNSFVAVVTTRFDDPISLTDLHSFLLSQEALLSSQSSHSLDLLALHCHHQQPKSSSVIAGPSSASLFTLCPLITNSMGPFVNAFAFKPFLPVRPARSADLFTPFASSIDRVKIGHG